MGKIDCQGKLNVQNTYIQAYNNEIFNQQRRQSMSGSSGGKGGVIMKAAQ